MTASPKSPAPIRGRTQFIPLVHFETRRLTDPTPRWRRVIRLVLVFVLGFAAAMMTRWLD